jgi:signal transduction histidine kinase
MRADAMAMARVDRLRLEQVVANLLDNALKFSPADRPVDVDVAATDALVTISVTDQGIGIPPDQRDRVFDRFFQAHASEYLSGLGLGLYVSRQIVEQHGGTIDAVFPETGGTRFVVRLPRGR